MTFLPVELERPSNGRENKCAGYGSPIVGRKNKIQGVKLVGRGQLRIQARSKNVIGEEKITKKPK